MMLDCPLSTDTYFTISINTHTRTRTHTHIHTHTYTHSHMHACICKCMNRSLACTQIELQKLMSSLDSTTDLCGMRISVKKIK